MSHLNGIAMEMALSRQVSEETWINFRQQSFQFYTSLYWGQQRADEGPP